MNLIQSHTRRAFGCFVLCLCLKVLPVTALATDDRPQEIASRLDAKWLADTKQIWTPEHTIYYHGSATGDVGQDGKHWAGEIQGEILVLTPTTATACSKFRLGSNGSISIHGPHQTIEIADVMPPWQKLLGKLK